MVRVLDVVPAPWHKGSYPLTDSDILAADDDGGATGQWASGADLPDIDS